MDKTQTKQQDALLAELDLHKTEFSALRDEILHYLNSEKQALNLSMVAAGVGLSILPLISKENTYFMLLIFPLVFHVILWEMLGAVRAISVISGYLVQVLIPRVNEILNQLGRANEKISALGWEMYIAPKTTKPSQLLLSSFTPTRHWVPILSVAGLLITYALIVQNDGHTPSSGEIALIFLNLLLLIWAGIQNTLVARAYSNITNIQQKTKESESATNKKE